MIERVLSRIALSTSSALSLILLLTEGPTTKAAVFLCTFCIVAAVRCGPVIPTKAKASDE